jgi:hypothetical protein
LPTAQPDRPDRLLLALHREQTAVRPRPEVADQLLRPLAFDDQCEVASVEVIAELGVVDELAGEQPFDRLAPALRRAAGPLLLLDGSEQAVAQSCLRGEQEPKL